MPAIVIIITAFMLFLDAAPLPYFPYYIILRIVVTIVFIWAVLFLFLKKEDPRLALFFGIGALLFNPIIVIEMPKLIWFFIDFVFGSLLLFNFKNLQGHDDEIDTKDDKRYGVGEFVGKQKDNKTDVEN